MANRMLHRTVIAGLVAIALSACHGDSTSPNQLTSGEAALAKGRGGGGGGGKSGSLYADLLVLYRDVNGVPIVYPQQFVDERGNVTWCVQPVTESAEVPNPYYVLRGEGSEYLPRDLVNPVSGRKITLIPLFAHYQEFLPIEEEETSGHATIMSRPDGKGPPEGKGPSKEKDSAPGPCDILVLTDGAGNVIYDASSFAEEVDLARLNLVRSPAHVLRQQLDEVELLFAGTQPDAVTLDAAGRFVFDGTLVDAAPKLQAIREALLETGTIPGTEVWATSPTPYLFPFQLVNEEFARWSTYEHSAFALAGAASKFDPVSIDAVSYHDRIMGTAAEGTWVNTFTSAELGENFVDYSAFTYDRAGAFPGCATLMDPITGANVVVPYVGEQSRVEFNDLGADETGAYAPATKNLAGYAQMVEDTRAVIYFLHQYSDLYMTVKDPVGVNTCADQKTALATMAPTKS